MCPVEVLHCGSVISEEGRSSDLLVQHIVRLSTTHSTAQTQKVCYVRLPARYLLQMALER